MKQLNTSLIALFLLLSLTAFAEESPIHPQTQGDVSFISGGIGGDEWNALQAAKADYNLRLLFTVQGTGEYLSNVKVSIADAKGNPAVEADADGPLFFAKLKPGRYTVNADLDGKTFQKKVTIGNKKPVSLSFVWPQ
jgi:hypothetical protein